MSQMPNERPELSESLQRAADALLTTAEHCYRLARRTKDRQAIETLLKLGEECEQRAEELRDLGET
jgi:hypothetical protein